MSSKGWKIKWQLYQSKKRLNSHILQKADIEGKGYLRIEILEVYNK